MAKRARLARHPLGEALDADGGHLVLPTPSTTNAPERTTSPMARDTGSDSPVRIDSSRRKVHRGEQPAIGDDLIARLSTRTSPTTTSWPPRTAPRPRDSPARGAATRQRESIQGALGADLLRDSDAGIGDDHSEKQRVTPIAERESQNAEAGENRVEHRQHIRAHDARVGPARALPPARPAPRNRRAASSSLSPASAPAPPDSDASSRAEFSEPADAYVVHRDDPSDGLCAIRR